MLQCACACVPMCVQVRAPALTQLSKSGFPASVLACVYVCVCAPVHLLGPVYALVYASVLACCRSESRAGHTPQELRGLILKLVLGLRSSSSERLQRCCLCGNWVGEAHNGRCVCFCGGAAVLRQEAHHQPPRDRWLHPRDQVDHDQPLVLDLGGGVEAEGADARVPTACGCGRFVDAHWPGRALGWLAR
eukprot:11897162-Alexandrium_andersonii.AAC.1